MAMNFFARANVEQIFLALLATAAVQVVFIGTSTVQSVQVETGHNL